MTPSHTYSATCWREGPAWVVHIPEIDATLRTARLSQVEAVARELVARVGGDTIPARVVVNLQVPDNLLELLAATAAAREERDRVSVEAVTLRRGLARRLAAEGFAVRDVAGLLGLSIARAHQLVADGSQPPPRSTARRVGTPRPRVDPTPAARAAPRPGRHPRPR